MNNTRLPSGENCGSPPSATLFGAPPPAGDHEDAALAAVTGCRSGRRRRIRCTRCGCRSANSAGRSRSPASVLSVRDVPLARSSSRMAPMRGVRPCGVQHLAAVGAEAGLVFECRIVARSGASAAPFGRALSRAGRRHGRAAVLPSGQVATSRSILTVKASPSSCCWTRSGAVTFCSTLGVERDVGWLRRSACRRATACPAPRSPPPANRASS